MEILISLLTSLFGASGGTFAVWMWFRGRLEKYLDSYLAEKGKVLARREDIEALRMEVRVLTKEAETIKATIGHEMWGKQRLWEQKRLLYAEILTLLSRLAMTAAQGRQGIKELHEINSGN